MSARLVALRRLLRRARARRGPGDRRRRRPVSVGVPRRRSHPAGERRARVHLRRLAVLGADRGRGRGLRAGPQRRRRAPWSATRSRPGPRPTAAARASVGLGFQGGDVSYASHRRLRRRFAGRLVDVGARVSALREVKDEAELRLMRAAAAIADAALEEVVAQGLRGRTEAAVAWAVEQAVRSGGAEAVAFATIVAAGPRGALPHAIPGDDVIGDGDLVVIDMGARLDGYHSDITRTFAVGRAAAEERAVYDDRPGGPARGARGRARRRRGPRRRRRRARRHRGRRLRRAVRSRHGSRRRPRDPRGAAAEPARPRAARAGHGRHGRARHLPRGSLRRAHRRHGGRHGDGCERLTLFPKELRVVG